MRAIVFIALMAILQSSVTRPSEPVSEICLTSEEKKLYDLMMDYRKGKGLELIPISAKLSQVAQVHARDLADNYEFDPDNKCNPHSWSKKGNWSACCYTKDHKQAKCMWDKPKEIADYNGAGYEIAYYSSRGATAEEGLAGWKKSPAHDPLIINEGIWAKAKWKGIGMGIYEEYGVVWFGEAEDTTAIRVCTAP